MLEPCQNFFFVLRPSLLNQNLFQRLESQINENATVVLVSETTESDLTSVSEAATLADPVELSVYHVYIDTDTFETGHKKVQCIQSHKRSKCKFSSFCHQKEL